MSDKDQIQLVRMSTSTIDQIHRQNALAENGDAQERQYRIRRRQLEIRLKEQGTTLENLTLETLMLYMYHLGLVDGINGGVFDAMKLNIKHTNYGEDAQKDDFWADDTDEGDLTA